MKKSISTLLLLAALTSTSVVVTSCGDDDPIENPTGGSIDRNNLQGEFTSDVVLESGTYKLTGPLIMKSGTKLTVKPGVVIEATKFQTGEQIRYIAISQGAQIFVEGTTEKPVVMTAEEGNKVQQAWGGVVICGKAPINKGTTATAEVSELTYGGTVANDNSGTIKYLRIEYSGYSYSADKEFNGLSMFGVGSGTTIEYVQVHEGSDDGFEWFGGTVNTKYLVSTSNEDDQFDWTEGWNGTNEYWYAKEVSSKGNRGIEADNNSNNHLASPISNPTIKNMTLIGRGDVGEEKQALKLRVGTKGQFENLVLSNWAVGFDVQHDEGVGYVGDGTLKAVKVKFDNVLTKSKGTKSVPAGSPEDTKGESVDVSAIFTEDESATGAGNGTATPDWAQGWTVGL